MPLGTWISRKTPVLWWSADCRNISRSDSLPTADTLYFSASCILQGKEEKKNPLLIPNSSFLQTFASKAVPHQTDDFTVYFAEVPLYAFNADFSVGKYDLPLKISWISSPGTGGILGQAEIHRLIPDLWKLTSKPSPSSMCFNCLYRC